MFVGTYEHSLDDKGRVVLPSSLRNELMGQGVISQIDRCLGIWTVDGFREVGDRMLASIREGQARLDAMRALASAADTVRPDGQGRIVIPQRLRDFAGLDKDVVIIGAFDHIEVWDADRWRDSQPNLDQSLFDAVTGQGL